MKVRVSMPDQVPEGLSQLILQARDSRGAATLVRQLATLGMARAQLEEVQMRAMGLWPGGRDAEEVLVRLPEGGPLCETVREWAQTTEMSAGRILLALAIAGWQYREAAVGGTTSAVTGVIGVQPEPRQRPAAVKQERSISKQNRGSSKQADPDGTGAVPASTADNKLLTPQAVIESMTPASMALANSLMAQFGYDETPGATT